MAILKNIKKDVYITLDLNLTAESPRWIGYTLRLFVINGRKTKEILGIHKENELSFENFIEPEIPVLCKGLDSIVSGETKNYLFEPIDEKDFCLEIKHERDEYKVNIFFEEALLLGVHQWNAHSRIGVQMQVEVDSIVSFSKELREEFNALMVPLK